MNNLLAIGIIVIVLGNAIWYIIRKRKKGITCIGCPDGDCNACKEAHHCNNANHQ